MPKWHTLRPPQSLRRLTFLPTSPHRAPTVVPPCPLPSPKVTLSVPFWHSSGYPGPSVADEGCGVTAELRVKTFRLTRSGGRGGTNQIKRMNGH